MFYIPFAIIEEPKHLFRGHCVTLLRKTKFHFTALRILVVFVLLCLLPARPAAAQQTLGSIRDAANRLFSAGEFADALPFLEQLIEIQGSSRDTHVVSTLEPIYWNAAMCKFFVGDFAGARTAYERYNGKYRHGLHVHESYVYIGDCLRYLNMPVEAIAQYKTALKAFSYPPDTRTDIYASIARCHLAQDDWASSVQPLKQALASAPDALRRNRAATLLATAYLKNMDLEEIYRIVPYLLTRDSLASRSIAFNMAALEAGDRLFGDERYREAFWIHRLVYPYDEIMVHTESYVAQLKAMIAQTQRYVVNPRRLMRLNEWLADAEEELRQLQENMENYDAELLFRIARGYMESKRFREACELFVRINAIGGAERADEALYLAFVCAVQIPPHARAYAIGRKYMNDFPSGAWYDMLTLMMGQMKASEKDWPGAVRHLSEVLQSHPGHQSAAECLYLLGYAHFMEEEFEQSRARFQEIRTKFPECDLLADAIYWCAMGYVFDGDFESGDKDFAELIERCPDCRYVQDAIYRRAVCSFALGQYGIAEARLASFIRDYPGNELVAEAMMTRGDIAGAVGRLDDAVAFYQEAMNVATNELNIEQYNHCAFQTGEILYDAGKYAELRDHFRRYIKRGRAESNIPLAIYWMGRAMLQQGELAGALRFYRDATLRFGRDRLQVGVDMILDEWVAASRKCSPAESKTAWDDIGHVIGNAESAGDKVSALRFERLRLYRPGITESEKNRIRDGLCKPENLTNASPAVLETMLDTARERGWTNFAVRVANQIIADFTETDYALDARALLADIALAQAVGEPVGSKRAESLVASAIRNLTVIREVYATSPEAAEALIKLGEIYTMQGKTDDADQCYREVLGVRDWRPQWPRALFGRGTCAEKKGDWLKAAAYYERIYVMYGGYRAMTAKAYLARAKCLRRGYETKKAIETLTAMRANEDLRSFPEYAEAGRLLSALGGAE